MSSSNLASDEQVLAGLAGLAERAAAGALNESLLCQVVTATVNIFARSCEQAGYELTPIHGEVSTTDVVRLSVALARSQELTAFEMSLWFAKRGGQAPTALTA